MLILGIDTSARQGSVALLRGEGPAPAAGAALVAAYPPAFAAQVSTVELAMLGEGRASEVLVPAIDGLLARHAVQKSSLGLVAVASGPGSFTGLRVALATAKGVAEAFAIPAVPVSVLEALAIGSSAQGRVLAALDAQRGELFFGEYILDAAAPHPSQRVREEIAGVDSFAAGLGAATLYTADEALAARLRGAAGQAALDIVLLNRPTAEDIARIAYRKYLGGFRADVATLDANYVRRSDAEIVFEQKRGGVS